MRGRSLTRTSLTVSSEEGGEELSEVGEWLSLPGEGSPEEEDEGDDEDRALALASRSSSLRAESASDLRIERRASAQATDWRMSRGASGAPESPVAVAGAEKAEKGEWGKFGFGSGAGGAEDAEGEDHGEGAAAAAEGPPLLPLGPPLFPLAPQLPAHPTSTALPAAASHCLRGLDRPSTPGTAAALARSRRTP